MRCDGRKAKNPRKTLLRLLGYMKQYIPILVIVLLCIVVTSVAQTRGSENVGNLVDDFILPMVASGKAEYEQKKKENAKKRGEAKKIEKAKERVEALEKEDHPFLIGVQWHPERMIGEECEHLPNMLPLFRHFIDLCKK